MLLFVRLSVNLRAHTESGLSVWKNWQLTIMETYGYPTTTGPWPVEREKRQSWNLLAIVC